MFSMKAKVKMGDKEFIYSSSTSTLTELFQDFLQTMKLNVEREVDKELDS